MMRGGKIEGREKKRRKGKWLNGGGNRKFGGQK
jgi:hypothetical protein